MAIEREEINNIAQRAAEEVIECRKCAIGTIDILESFGLLDEMTKYYKIGWMEDIAKAQIHDTKLVLSSRLRGLINSCNLADDSPVAKIATDLDKADTLDKIRWAIQNLEGALYQSLRDY